MKYIMIRIMIPRSWIFQFEITIVGSYLFDNRQKLYTRPYINYYHVLCYITATCGHKT